MPSHTVHSTLLQMSLNTNSMPWNYRQWQDITSVCHGHFPAEDHLPPVGWMRKSAKFILSYIDQYSKKKKEDDKIKFSAMHTGSTEVPGRDLWCNWVTQSWKDWKIHARIITVLSKENLHPFMLTVATDTSSSDTWPNGGTLIPLVIDSVRADLYGEEALDQFGCVHAALWTTLQALIQRTWTNRYNQFQHSKMHIINLEKDATSAFDNLQRDKLTKTNIRAVIIKVACQRALAEVINMKENVEKIERMEEELQSLMLGLRVQLHATPKVKPGLA
ncbi:hypothetical protein APHAL10511_008248 [Amanita phalloides]|nr:hypothetical protein APHAL10511_008248 [Amanita phalloides]